MTTADSRRNHLDLVRLVSAFAVLAGHSWGLTGRVDPLHGVVHNQLGTIGVLSFFGLSGYLITQSFRSDPRPWAFARKRLLRLMPALIVAAVLTALILGPLVTTRSTSAYFASPTTYGYIIHQLVLDTFNLALPGVFAHNPIDHVVNGSLWTIPLEACCYVAVAVAGVLGLLKRNWLLPAILLLVALALAVHAPPDDPHGNAPSGIDVMLNALRVCGAFLTGSLLWIRGDLASVTPRRAAAVALVAVVAIVLPLPAGMHAALSIVAVPVLALVVGLRPPGRLGFLTRPGDVSYGVYVYAYPVQQLLVDKVDGIRPVAVVALAGVAAYLLGLLSWRIVEEPALRLKPRRATAARPPDAEPAVAIGAAPPMPRP